MFKNTLSLFLIFCMLVESFLPAVEMDELAKIPYLFEHFTEHKHKDPSISFIDFLKLHFDNTSHHNLDHQAHDKLPLTNHNHQTHVEFHSIALTVVYVSTLASLIPLQEISKVEYQEPTACLMSISIWQPPRIS